MLAVGEAFGVRSRTRGDLAYPRLAEAVVWGVSDSLVRRWVSPSTSPEVTRRACIPWSCQSDTNKGGQAVPGATLQEREPQNVTTTDCDLLAVTMNSQPTVRFFPLESPKTLDYVRHETAPREQGP